MPGVENNALLSSLTCEHDPDALVAGLAPVHRVSVAVVNTKQILLSISYRYFLVISLLATLKSKMMNIQILKFEMQ